MGLATDTLASGGIDTLGLNPHTASWLTAVYSIANRKLPFLGPFLKDGFEVSRNEAQDDLERDLVQATFRRPLLFILYRG